MKNGVFLIVIAFVVAELFKILIYANLRNCDVPTMTRNNIKSQYRIPGQKGVEILRG